MNQQSERSPLCDDCGEPVEMLAGCRYATIRCSGCGFVFWRYAIKPPGDSVEIDGVEVPPFVTEEMVERGIERSKARDER